MGSQIAANLAPHVIIFPLPVQGHVNTMLRLAELLCPAKLDVTFIVSKFNHARVLKHSTIASRFARYPGFQFQTISDGLSDEHSRADWGFEDLVIAIKNFMPPLFKKMMVENNYLASATRRAVSCIIADGVSLSFAADFAEEHGLALVYFRTVSACSFWATFCIPELIQAKELPIKEDLNLPVKSMPGMEGLVRRRDLPHFFRVSDLNDITFQMIIRETRQMSRAQGVILNTFEDLEGPILSQIRKHMPRLYTIGPNHSHLEVRIAAKHPETSGVSAGSWEEDRNCLAWLDSQPEKSVIYVSFGSITVLTREQLLEFCYGLLNSERRFLWVTRPDSIMGKDGQGQIPAEPKSRGYVVGWAPQQEVLNHPAIGGFLTHGGWNSILESVVAGVPMICWPFFGDQTINSRFASEVWKVGMDMKDTCDRAVIEKMVRDLMKGRKNEFLQGIDGLAKLGRKAVGEGGTSYDNLDNLVEFLKSTV